MADAFIGEIRMFGFNFAPRNWATCSGQILAIAQNQALFSLLGTNYGGDGRATYGLPDLQGRVPVGQGGGYQLGQLAGEENVSVNSQTLAPHTHFFQATSAPATERTPSGNTLAQPPELHPMFTPDVRSFVNLKWDSLAQVGGNQAHTNLEPFLVSNFCICLTGTFPSRN